MKEIGHVALPAGEFLIEIDASFEAAHSLRRYFADGSDEPLHGHTFSVQLQLARRDRGIGDDGMAVDFIPARSALDAILGTFNYRNLNELAIFADLNPTAENIARVIAASVSEALLAAGGEGELLEVVVGEGPKNRARFRPCRSV